MVSLNGQEFTEIISATGPNARELDSTVSVTIVTVGDGEPPARIKVSPKATKLTGALWVKRRTRELVEFFNLKRAPDYLCQFSWKLPA